MAWEDAPTQDQIRNIVKAARQAGIDLTEMDMPSTRAEARRLQYDLHGKRRMKWHATSPDGKKEIRAEEVPDGVRVCISESPEVCTTHPDAVATKIVMHRLWHKGWKIDVE